MPFSRENYLKIKDQFAQKASRAREAAQARLQTLHRDYPDLRDIDRALAATGQAVFYETMRGKDGLEERLAKLRQDNLELQANRRACLEFYGFPADYTDPQYECKKCDDSGVIGSRMCECFRRALVLATYESSGIGALLATQSFDTFDLSYYQGQSRKLAEAALHVCRDFAEGFPNAACRNITLQGATGLGKTHLSTAIAKAVIDRGCDVVYETAQNILFDLGNVQFGRAEAEAAERYQKCDLLIIDDLGTELNNQFTVSALYNLLNTRINAGLGTVVSTNLKPEEFRSRYADRITSRLLGEFTLLPMTGTDIRSQKLKQKMK